MQGTFCIFDLEPNKNFKFGILRFSWLICKYDNNNLITLTTKDFFINQDHIKNFINHEYKFHGISNKKLKLEGESILYVLEQFAKDLKNFQIDYISGYRIKNTDIPFIHKLANEYNLTELKEDFVNKKYIIMDTYELLGQWTKKNTLNIKLDFETLYPYLFKMKYPKTKYHNTNTECEHCRNVLFYLISKDISIFDDIQPLIKDKIDFKKIEELKNLVDEQLMEENDSLKSVIYDMEKRILKLEVNKEKQEDESELINKRMMESDKKYLDMRDKCIRLECKNEDLEKKIEIREKKLEDINRQFTKHKEISKRCIDQLKDKVKELDKPIDQVIEQYIDYKYKDLEYTDKECIICSKDVEDICDKCKKCFCDFHIHSINDGFNTSACDKCFNEVYDKYVAYKLNNEIVLL